jgi:hypothetical protein
MNQELLQVGYARVNITPEESVPLAGYGNTSMRLSQSVRDETFATCAAITDASGRTVLLYASDMVSTLASLFDGIRQDISEATGVPFDNIHFSASHMHSGADLSNVDFPSVVRYRAQLAGYMLAAAKEALADRKPARMYVTSTVTKGLNFVRRYKLKGDIYVGYQSDITDRNLLAGHETDADPQLQLVKFKREGGKDLVVANFQTHPHRGGGAKKYEITADIVGAFRNKLEAELGCHAMYFTGASGNINPTSQIQSENIVFSIEEHGEALAQYALDAENTYVPVSGGKVQALHHVYVGKINHTQDHMVEQAKQIQALWKECNSIAECRRVGLPMGINSPYHAGAIIAKAGMPETSSFDIYAVSAGDVAFVAVPYEMYDTNGMYIKEHSPFPTTIVMTCCDGGNGYFPSLFAYSHGGYEPDTTRYAPGTAEDLAETYVKLLNQLYENR